MALGVKEPFVTHVGAISDASAARKIVEFLKEPQPGIFTIRLEAGEMSYWHIRREKKNISVGAVISEAFCVELVSGKRPKTVLFLSKELIASLFDALNENRQWNPQRIDEKVDFLRNKLKDEKFELSGERFPLLAPLLPHLRSPEMFDVKKAFSSQGETKVRLERDYNVISKMIELHNAGLDARTRTASLLDEFTKDGNVEPNLKTSLRKAGFFTDAKMIEGATYLKKDPALEGKLREYAGGEKRGDAREFVKGLMEEFKSGPSQHALSFYGLNAEANLFRGGKYLKKHPELERRLGEYAGGEKRDAREFVNGLMKEFKSGSLRHALSFYGLNTEANLVRGGKYLKKHPELERRLGEYARKAEGEKEPEKFAGDLMGEFGVASLYHALYYYGLMDLYAIVDKAVKDAAIKRRGQVGSSAERCY